MTPKLFWEHRDELLGAPRSKLPALAQSIAAASSGSSSHATWATRPTSIQKVAGQLCICANAELPKPLTKYLPDSTEHSAAYVQISSSSEAATATHTEQTNAQHPSHLTVHAAEGKRGQYQFLQTVLPLSLAFIAKELRLGSRICISCETGKDMAVGVALAALQTFFDEDGCLALDKPANHMRMSVPSLRHAKL